MSILIKNCDPDYIFIEDNTITSIGDKVEADHVIDASGKALMPGLVNTHTHSAMTLLRSYADDIQLDEWLQKKIWPLEQKLTGELVYWGTRLACLEMVKSGTTAFNDMYFFMNDTARATADSGMRATLGYGFIDLNDAEKAEKERAATQDFFKHVEEMKNERVRAAVGPHAIYTVSDASLKWCKEFADKKNAVLHIHISETKNENNESKKKHNATPVQHLDELGVLGNNVVAAHCVWLEDKDISTLQNRGVSVAHCPSSNAKLGSGTMDYAKMKGLNISLATDGAASNNSLDMLSEMKLACIAQKPTVLKAQDAWQMGTENGAKALHLNAGKIDVGALADFILIDQKQASLTPNHNLISNLVYSANGSCVIDTIIDGKVVMKDRKVEGEEEIIAKASDFAKELVK